MKRDYIPLYFYLCPKCNHYPFMFFDYSKQMNINIKCSCGFQNEYIIEEFICLLNERNTYFDCQIHKYPFKKYCITCNIHLCYKCDKHKDHKIYKLGKNVHISKIKKYLNKAYDLINNEFYNRKQKLVKYLLQRYSKPENMLSKLENSYAQCVYRNNNLLTVLGSLVDTYSKYHPNYFLEKSIIRNCHINLKKPEWKKKKKIWIRRPRRRRRRRNRIGLQILLDNKKTLYKYLNSYFVTSPQEIYCFCSTNFTVITNELIAYIDFGEITVFNFLLHQDEFFTGKIDPDVKWLVKYKISL